MDHRWEHFGTWMGRFTMGTRSSAIYTHHRPPPSGRLYLLFAKCGGTAHSPSLATLCSQPLRIVAKTYLQSAVELPILLQSKCIGHALQPTAAYCNKISSRRSPAAIKVSRCTKTVSRAMAFPDINSHQERYEVLIYGMKNEGVWVKVCS